MFNNRPLTSELHAHQQQIEQRKQLIQIMRAETDTVHRVMALLSQQTHVDKQACLTVLDDSLAAIDRVLQAGDWESSLFLRNTIKPIKALNEKIIHLKTGLMSNNEAKTLVPAVPAGMILVYVALFQTEGLNLSRWAMQIRSLAHYVQGRPIYRLEEAVQRMIRSKLDHSNDAYAVVAITPEMIMSEAAPRVDRNGCELLMLTDHAIKEGQLIEFVHQDKRYCWLDNQLILQT